MKCDLYTCHREADLHASQLLDGEYCARHAFAVLKSLSRIHTSVREEDDLSEEQPLSRFVRAEVLA